jgi:hypothetical protein
VQHRARCSGRTIRGLRRRPAGSGARVRAIFFPEHMRTTTRSNPAPWQRWVLPRGRHAALLFGALLLQTGCNDPVAPLPRDGAPEQLSFYIGGFAGDSHTWELRGDTVLFRRVPWTTPGTPSEERKAVPTAEAWRHFWSAAEEAGVRRWSREYTAPNVADGTGWGLRLAAGRLQVASQGSNAYPDGRGRAHALDTTHEFRLLVAALEALVVADP